MLYNEYQWIILEGPHSLTFHVRFYMLSQFGYVCVMLDNTTVALGPCDSPAFSIGKQRSSPKTLQWNLVLANTRAISFLGAPSMRQGLDLLKYWWENYQEPNWFITPPETSGSPEMQSKMVSYHHLSVSVCICRQCAIQSSRVWTSFAALQPLSLQLIGVISLQLFSLQLTGVISLQLTGLTRPTARLQACLYASRHGPLRKAGSPQSPSHGSWSSAASPHHRTRHRGMPGSHVGQPELPMPAFRGRGAEFWKFGV